MYLFTTLFVAGLLIAGTPDTLQTASIIADHSVAVSRTDTLKINNSQTITELLLQSPSTYVGDYGSYSGLKTVSLRGLGSPHTSIYIDGIRIGNVQSGQGDLGAINLDSFSSVVIDYAQNSLSFITERPLFEGNRIISGKTSFSYGSFGTYLPTAKLNWKISDKIYASLNTDAVISKGNFDYADGQIRENNDIRQTRSSLDFFGLMPNGRWQVKAWHNAAERGTAGSTSWPSTDRQKDNNVFVQGLLSKQLSRLYSIKVSAKVSYDDISYISSWGDSRYGQIEGQLNSSHKFKLKDWFAFSITADLFWDDLKSNYYSQKRWGTRDIIAAVLHNERIKADIALQYDGVFDIGVRNRNCLSPSISLRYSVFDNLDIVAFGRKAYRIPSFNELYYIGYGNPELENEEAWLTDIGIDWTHKLGKIIVKTKFDAYLNYLTNKITSAPSSFDPNIWLPYNIGRVRSSGLDLLLGFDYRNNDCLLSFNIKYSYQNAVDKTPDSNTYNNQIAYIAQNSLYINTSASVKDWSAELFWNLRSGRMDSYGSMPDWNTLDLQIKKSYDLGMAGTPSLKLSLKNITDYRYELVSGYPMPGFSIIAGLEYCF